MLEKMIVSYDYSNKSDISVLTVAKLKDDLSLEFITTIFGDEAQDIYKILKGE